MLYVVKYGKEYSIFHISELGLVDARYELNIIYQENFVQFICNYNAVCEERETLNLHFLFFTSARWSAPSCSSFHWCGSWAVFRVLT